MYQAVKKLSDKYLESFIDTAAALTAAADPCWDGYKQVGMKKGKGGKMVPNCVPVDASDDSSDAELAAKKKRTISQTRAPKKDRIYGSSKNKKGSASSGKSGAVKFSARTEKSLKKKVKEHNEKAREGRKVTLGMLKAAYRRGAGAFSGSHRPGMGRDQWAMARVNAFLKLVKSGKPSNPNYKTDNDLLPASHPRSTKSKNSSSSLIASIALVPEEKDLAEALLEVVAKHGKFDEDGDGVWAGYTPPAENEVARIGVICRNCVFYSEDEDGNDICQIISVPIEDLGKCRFAVIPDSLIDKDAIEQYMMEKEEAISDLQYIEDLTYTLFDTIEEYESPERAITALAESSEFSYDADVALRAAWLRGVKNDEDPYKRARNLAELGYESIDADLLPIIEKDLS